MTQTCQIKPKKHLLQNQIKNWQSFLHDNPWGRCPRITLPPSRSKPWPKLSQNEPTLLQWPLEEPQHPNNSLQLALPIWTILGTETHFLMKRNPWIIRWSSRPIGEDRLKMLALISLVDSIWTQCKKTQPRRKLIGVRAPQESDSLNFKGFSFYQILLCYKTKTRGALYISTLLNYNYLQM